MIALTERAEGVVVPVKAQPGARKNALLGERAGVLRVAVSAPPEKGKANEAIRDVLAEALGCRPGQITLWTGATSRSKSYLVTGLPPESLRSRLDQSLASVEAASRSQS